MVQSGCYSSTPEVYILTSRKKKAEGRYTVSTLIEDFVYIHMHTTSTPIYNPIGQYFFIWPYQDTRGSGKCSFYSGQACIQIQLWEIILCCISSYFAFYLLKKMAFPLKARILFWVHPQHQIFQCERAIEVIQFSDFQTIFLISIILFFERNALCDPNK